MRDFALSETLRPDIKVNGLESWLLSQLRYGFFELGDKSTKPLWNKRAKDTISFLEKLSENLMYSVENCWLLYEGLHNEVSWGTLQLIRSSLDDILDHVWDLSGAADDVADDLRNLVSFFKCAELKPEIRIPEDSVPYVRNPAGMKIEARGIRYKYDPDDEDEVLRGASFVINPGTMVAVVG